jgi:large subunit ribosomal protein L30
MAKMAKKAEKKQPAAGRTRAKSAAPRDASGRPEHKSRDVAQRVTVTLVKSTIGFGKKQAAVVEGLGLRRLNHTVELADTPSIRGMIHKVRHLLEVK